MNKIRNENSFQAVISLDYLENQIYNLDYIIQNLSGENGQKLLNGLAIDDNQGEGQAILSINNKINKLESQNKNVIANLEKIKNGMKEYVDVLRGERGQVNLTNNFINIDMEEMHDIIFGNNGIKEIINKKVINNMIDESDSFKEWLRLQINDSESEQKNEILHNKNILNELDYELSEHLGQVNYSVEILKDIIEILHLFFLQLLEIKISSAGVIIEAEFLKIVSNNPNIEEELRKLARILNSSELKVIISDISSFITTHPLIERTLFTVFKDSISTILGFEYNEEEDYYYTNDSSIQSKLGFADIIDELGPFLGMDLETEIIVFQYGDKEYRVQLWKGVYGFGGAYGTEVGIYSRPIEDAIAHPYVQGSEESLGIHYDCISEEEQVDIENTLYDSNGNVLINNDTSEYEGDHFWNLAIKTDTPGDVLDGAYTETKITIPSVEVRAEFIESLEKEEGITNIRVEGDDVIFTWDK